MGDDIWIGTGHGLARGIGRGYYAGLRGKGSSAGSLKGSASPK
jgi:hypothetical protein